MEFSDFGQVEQRLKAIHGEMGMIRRLVDFSEKALSTPTMSEVFEFLDSNQLSMPETVQYIAQEGHSISRYGDGEFLMMFDPLYELDFQKNSFELGKELQESFQTFLPNLMIGLPQFARGEWWRKFWTVHWPLIKPRLNSRIKYGNAHISRPLFFQQYGDDAVDMWRQVWAGKHVAIVTGKGSRFELVPELFDTALKVDRVDSLAQNAFSDLTRLMELDELRQYDQLIISLGPAGSILATKLARIGIGALDIGHLTHSYKEVYGTS